MRPAIVPKPDEALWASTLISANTEALIAAARNYLGPVKTPYDKRDLVERLGAFLRRPDTREAVVELLDPLDVRVLGTLFLLGPASEATIRGLFAGELPLFDLGLRIANLQDRLLLFRFVCGGAALLAVNPLLTEALGEVLLDASLLFGPEPSPSAYRDEWTDKSRGATEEGRPVRASEVRAAEGTRGRGAHDRGEDYALCDAKTVVAFFAFLFHSPGCLRKGGGLTKKGLERAASLFPEFAAFENSASAKSSSADSNSEEGAVEGSAALGAASALAKAFAAAGFLALEGEERRPDLSAFAVTVSKHSEALPLALVAALAGGSGRETAEDFYYLGIDRGADFLSALISAAPEGLVFSRKGMIRWIRLASLRFIAASRTLGGFATGPSRSAHSHSGAAASASAMAEGASFGPAAASPIRGEVGDGADSSDRGEAYDHTSIVERLGQDPERLIQALESLGLVVSLRGGKGLAFRHFEVAGKLSAPEPNASGSGREAEDAKAQGSSEVSGEPVLVAEGSHLLHLMPEAGLEDRRFATALAAPRSIGKVWSLEIDRASARRAFAAGIGATAALTRLEAMAKRPLPQSLAFSLKAWEEEYRSLRLYRGMVLVADERLRAIVERSHSLAPLVAERLAPGVYVLAGGPEVVERALREAGLEVPPETHYASGSAPVSTTADQVSAAALSSASTPAAAPGSASRRGRTTWAGASAALAPLAALRVGGTERSRLDPSAREAVLKAALAIGGGGAVGAAAGAAATGNASAGSSPFSGASSPGVPPLSPSGVAYALAMDVEKAKELADRIERRIILTERQLALADARPERNEAVGLDYMGKVRIVERALRSPGDRLEILFRLPGAEPVRALLRPVRLEKTEKGLVLEAEDLALGGPVRVPLGAASSVRRLRASLFGEES